MPNNAKVSMIGNLVRDPEMKEVGSSKVLSMTVAVNTMSKKDDGTYDSNFYDVSYWGKPGEFVFDRLQKGTQVFVTGDFMQVEYKGQDGVNKYRLRVTAYDVRPISRLKGDSAPAETKDRKPAAPAGDNDLPF